MERKRLLLALVLSVTVLMGYSWVMKRFFPPPPTVEEPQATAPQSVPSSPPPAATPAPTAKSASATKPAPAKKPAPAIRPTPQASTPVAEEAPRDLIINTPYWKVTLTNHGAVATSWILHHYPDKGKDKPLLGADRDPLQLIPQPLPEGLDAPLALRLPAQPELAAQLNSTNYQTKIEGVAASG
ncbi:MAG TPA: hypothetical protein VIS78_05405, partial [Blastocatellia bacterium]